MGTCLVGSSRKKNRENHLKKEREEERENGEEGVTYLMSSWMTAFISKHPNMHPSATQGEIGLQHPISRGLLSPRRKAKCAPLSK